MVDTTRRKKMISQIVAVDANGGIGKDNSLPWHNPEEMKIFRMLTMGKTVFMGKNTYESLPEHPYDKENPHYGSTKGLKWRINVVISKSMCEGKQYELNKNNGVYVTKNLDILYKDCPLLTDERFVIGGTSIYEQTLDECEMIYLSRMKDEYDCDTFYPLEKLERFTKLSTVKYESFDLEIYKSY